VADKAPVGARAVNVLAVASARAVAPVEEEKEGSVWVPEEIVSVPTAAIGNNISWARPVMIVGAPSVERR